MLTIDKLVDKIKKNATDVDISRVVKAYHFAEKYHKGQMRKDNTPFIQHPLEVAYELAKFKFNTETFIAALLHDVIEDTEADADSVKENFGNEPLKLVLGVTKLSKIKLKKNLEEYSIENLRKMFLAMAQDIRVVLIKLADRYHNLKTLKYLDPRKRARIAKETMEIYAPLASRLGMGKLKGNFEDLSFSYINPKKYSWIKNITETEIDKRQEYLKKIKGELEQTLNKTGIEFIDIHGRAKHYYSLYKKLRKHDNNINKIYDLIALRIIVRTVTDCYKTLGIIHQNWKPLLGRIKDYISVPKTNGYQSLHTTILCPSNEIIEIQIRTPRMHMEAEYGIASSWYYAENGKPNMGSPVPKKLAWINELNKWQKELSDNKKFVEALKIDFFRDRIFVFTPKGEVLDLPDGSTPIDFAYHIHTDLGNHCSMAKINDKVVPLDYKLINGDVIKIITSANQEPKRDWFNFVHTTLAKNRIQGWFKKQNKSKNLEYGKNLLNQELLKLKKDPINKILKNKVRIDNALKKLNYKNFDDLIINIAQGDITPTQVIKNIYSEKEILPPKRKKFMFFEKPDTKTAIIQNEEGLLTNTAKCCNPELSDKIVAHITRFKGASIHKTNCKELKNIEKGRIVNASWIKKQPLESLVDIQIKSLDRLGLIQDITQQISNLGININNFKATPKQTDDTVHIYLTLGINDIDQLLCVLEKLKKGKGILEVEKINKKSRWL